MEVGKKINYHAGVVAFTVLMLLAVSTLLFNSYVTGISPGQTLTSRVLDIRPTKNGLVKISLHKAPSVQPAPNWTQAGRETALTFGF